MEVRRIFAVRARWAFAAGLAALVLFLSSAKAAEPAATHARSCIFTRPLYIGLRGEDVRCLQTYLNARGFRVASQGPGSPGQETTYFGPLTRSAVARWQRAHGVSPAYGYFGPISQTAYAASRIAAVADAVSEMEERDERTEETGEGRNTTDEDGRNERAVAEDREEDEEEQIEDDPEEDRIGAPDDTRTAADRGTTYYVDPATGTNSNSGTSPSAPWRNPPGTRSADNSRFYSAAWGAIIPRNKIACNDTILLKGGATQRSGQGGAWRIDNGHGEDGTGYYASDCGPDSPIAIRVATADEWADSSGNFTLDGTGVTATCLAFCGDTHGLVHIQDIDTLTLGGTSARQRLVVKGSDGANIAHNIVLASSGGATPVTGRFIGEWLELLGAQNDGISIGPARDLVVRDSIAHDNGWSGFSTGALNDNRVRAGGFENIEAYRNGPKGGPLGDQLLFLGCESCYVVRAKSHDGNLRGLNFGNIGPFGGTDMFLHIRDSAFWNNGLSADNQSVYQSGPCWSGDDAPEGQRQRGVMLRTVIAHNREGGGPCAYGQGWADVWNSVWWHNGYDKSVGGTGDITVADGGDFEHFGIFNSIVEKSKDGITWSGSGPSNFGSKQCPVSDYNLFVPEGSDDETLSDFDCTDGGAFTTKRMTYKNPPAFIGPHTLLGTSKKTGLELTQRESPGKSYTASDFRLSQDSSAIDAGTFLLRAASAGSGATIRVLGNGGSSDPRHYFIGPNSYYKATPDKIEIEGCGEVTITSMTASSVSFDRSCAWKAGAGIHFPWNGARPDMGAFEYGL